jgi:hypothetical protein
LAASCGEGREQGLPPRAPAPGKGLRETCAVPGGNFRNRLMAHLDLDDPETKKLLGLGYAEGEPKYLDIQGKASDLFARPQQPPDHRTRPAGRRVAAFAASWCEAVARTAWRKPA